MGRFAEPGHIGAAAAERDSGAVTHALSEKDDMNKRAKLRICILLKAKA
jgi:hypothetical protein